MSALWRRASDPEDSGGARTTQTYILGVGASGALLAGAGVALISLVGLVSFDVWPGTRGGGAEEQAQLNLRGPVGESGGGTSLSDAVGLVASATPLDTPGPAAPPSGEKPDDSKGDRQPPKGEPPATPPPADDSPATPTVPSPAPASEPVESGGRSGDGHSQNSGRDANEQHSQQDQPGNPGASSGRGSKNRTPPGQSRVGKVQVQSGGSGRGGSRGGTRGKPSRTPPAQTAPPVVTGTGSGSGGGNGSAANGR